MYRYVLYLRLEEQKKLVKFLEEILGRKAKDNEIDDDFLLLMTIITRLQMMEETFVA